jgi:hypothetical protein
MPLEDEPAAAAALPVGIDKDIVPDKMTVSKPA